MHILSKLSLGLAGLFVLLGGNAVCAQEDNPILAKVRAGVKDPAKPFTMIVRLQIKDGMAGQFEAAFAPGVTV